MASTRIRAKVKKLTVFQDKNILRTLTSFSEKPIYDELVGGRSESLKELENQLFLDGLDRAYKNLPEAKTTFLSGLHAVGKTYTIAYWFEKRLPEFRKHDIDAIYYDASGLSPLKVIQKIIRENFDENFTCRSLDEGLETLAYNLDTRPKTWIIFLDNAHSIDARSNFYRQVQNFYDPLVRMEENVIMPRSKVAWVFITTGENHMIKLEELQKSSKEKASQAGEVLSRIETQPVFYSDYSESEKTEILDFYVKHAFKSDTVDPAVTRYIARTEGEIRSCILKLRLCGINADKNGSQKVLLSHADAVSEDDIVKELWEKQILKLQPEHQAALIGIAYLQPEYIENMDCVPYTYCYNEYRRVAEKLGIGSKGKTKYGEILAELEEVRFVEKSYKKGGPAPSWLGVRLRVNPDAITRVLVPKLKIHKDPDTKGYQLI